MHYIKPVRVLSCMFKYIVMCLCFGREWLRLFPPFFVFGG